MAAYRQVHISFWQDPYIEDLSPKEKYFYLYLMTNSRTKQCGCYEISMKLIKYETGLTQQEIDSYIEKLSTGKKIGYDKQNQEFLLLNWLKHNSFKSPKVLACIEKELEFVKTQSFIDYINLFIEGNIPMDSLSIDYSKTIDTQSQEEEKEEKEEETKLDVAINDFKKHRVKIKKPMTDKAVDLFVKELNKYASTDEEKIELIEIAILKGWQTVYPKENNNSNKQSIDTSTLGERVTMWND
jgi:hypothetical protein